MRNKKIHTTVSENGLVEFVIPEFAHKHIEITICPIEEKGHSNTLRPAEILEQSSFVRNVLFDADEDVWNEL